MFKILSYISYYSLFKNLLYEKLVSYKHQSSDLHLKSVAGFYTIYFSFNWDSLPLPCKSEQPLRGMKIEEKAYRKSVRKEPTVKRCLLILDLKPLRLLVKRKQSIGRAFYRVLLCEEGNC